MRNSMLETWTAIDELCRNEITYDPEFEMLLDFRDDLSLLINDKYNEEVLRKLKDFLCINELVYTNRKTNTKIENSRTSTIKSDNYMSSSEKNIPIETIDFKTGNTDSQTVKFIESEFRSPIRKSF